MISAYIHSKKPLRRSEVFQWGEENLGRVYYSDVGIKDISFLTNLASRKLFVLFKSTGVYKPLRQRRRQQWHDKRKFTKKKKSHKKTIDGGVFPAELKAKKRSITFRDKLTVVNFWNKKKQEREDIIKKLEKPRPIGATKAVLKDFFAQRKKLKKQLRSNLQKLCREQFPDITKNCAVCRWVQKAEAEKWAEMPESLRSRATEAPNLWRQKVGAPRKGQPLGGKVPMAIQRELDWLMIEVSGGMSAVTERKELVTVENVVSCCFSIGKFWFEWFPEFSKKH